MAPVNPNKCRPVYSNPAEVLERVEDEVARGLSRALLGGNGVKRACNLIGCSDSTIYRVCDGKDAPSLRVLALAVASALCDPERSEEDALAPLSGLCRVFGLLTRPMAGLGQGNTDASTANVLRSIAALLDAKAEDNVDAAIDALRSTATSTADAEADYERERPPTDEVTQRREHLIRVATVRGTD
jgi:hypothetical protein